MNRLTVGAVLFLSLGHGVRADAEASKSVDWKRLMRSSMFLLGVQHGFRLATEPATRAGLKGPYWHGYAAAVSNMHGWADGDPFYVNYIGHPMQGAVSGFVWTNHDRRYAGVRIGKSREYWKSRLRAGGFMWAYSVQFEIGPLSEASLGKIQRYYPQQGYVDQVITPALGLVWMVGEDALDRFVVTPFENRVQNKWWRLAARGGLNPARTFANAMSWRSPEARMDRAGIKEYRGAIRPAPRDPPPAADGRTPPFEFATTTWVTHVSGQAGLWCAGGGGEAAFRLARRWQALVDVGACNVYGLDGPKLSGDGLTYLAGVRWRPAEGARLSPYAQVLLGGAKFTIETSDPVKKAAAHEWTRLHPDQPLSFDSFASLDETRGFAMAVGGGLDLRVNRALAVRLLGVEYGRGWMGAINGFDFTRGALFKTGLVLRMGTW